MGNRNNPMGEPLAGSDHLDPLRDVAPRSTEGPMASEGRFVEGRTGGADGEVALVSIQELQSKDLHKLMLDGIVITVLYFVVGCIWLMASSHWSFTNTVYFTVMSVLTVGYGDITVNAKVADRVVDTLLILIGLFALTTWAMYASCLKEFVRRREADRASAATAVFDSNTAILRDSWYITVIGVGLLVTLIVGSFTFMWGENVEFTTGVYWAIVTSSTIGYGDVVPTSDGMKWFTVVWSILATVLMIETLRSLGSFPFRVWTRRNEGKVFEQFEVKSQEDRQRVEMLMTKAVVSTLEAPLERGTGISRSEFALSMLLLLDRISFRDYQEAARLFDKMEVDREGAARVVAAAGANDKR